MEKLAGMLLKHLDGILNYCRTRLPRGVVEAVNANIKARLRRGRVDRNPDYLPVRRNLLILIGLRFCNTTDYWWQQMKLPILTETLPAISQCFFGIPPFR